MVLLAITQYRWSLIPPLNQQRVGEEDDKNHIVQHVVGVGDDNNRDDEEGQQNSHNEDIPGSLPQQPSGNISTEHYDMAQLLRKSQFTGHLEYLCRKIVKQWKHGWNRYESKDIANCIEQTPECQLFRLFWRKSDRPFVKCCVEHEALKKTAAWVAALLEKHNITYFLSTGSALGVYRHGGTIIPWDTDVDIAVYPGSQSKLRQVLSKQSTHFFREDPLGKPMYWVYNSTNGKPRDGPHVEVFYDPVYTSTPQALLPLQRCNFYEYRLWCPSVSMLDVWFPSGWQKYSGAHYHGKGKCTIYDRGRRRSASSC